MRPLRRSSPDESQRLGLAWAVLPADLLTPVAAFGALRSAGRRCALLESVEGPARLARHSFLAVDVDGSLRAGPERATLTRGDVTKTLDVPPQEALRAAARATRLESIPREHPDLPPFVGGWVGYASYEFAHTLEPTVLPFAAPREPGALDLLFEHSSDVVAFDHAAQTATVVCATVGLDGTPRDGAARVDAIAADLFAGGTVDGPEPFELVDETPRALGSEDEFRAGVRALKEAIGQGEIFQAVLARAFEQRFTGDPFTLYRVLRLVNPAPHMFFFDGGEELLIGSSPERLVSVQDGAVELVPIAGTRPRGANLDEDQALGAELQRDEKELAEHDMLVDLARNDAGRVARVGSVRVHEHRRLVRFPRVQHLVSRVRAELRPDRDAVDALVASFPAGTVSGAPKVRALQLIAQAEGTPRGAYGGAFGYLDRRGDLDLALTIRTIVCRDGRLRIQAGAGIVHDSDPEAELAETLHKSRAMFEAVELAASDAFRPVRQEAEVAR